MADDQAWGADVMSNQKFQIGDRVKPKEGSPFVIVNITMWNGEIAYSSRQQGWYWADYLTLMPERAGYVASKRLVFDRTADRVLLGRGLYRCETDAELAARHAIERAAYDAQGDEA